jgi:hypothetical protein
MATNYDDRLIRMSLDRIAHALEAIARSKDPGFKTLAEAKTLAAEAKPKRETGADTGAQSARRSQRARRGARRSLSVGRRPA